MYEVIMLILFSEMYTYTRQGRVKYKLRLLVLTHQGNCNK